MAKEVYINSDGVAKLSESRKKSERKDPLRALGQQVDNYLKEKVLEPMIKEIPNAYEVLMGYLSYESEKPLIFSKNGAKDPQEFYVESAKKEGIGFIYEKLNKLGKEIKECQEK